MEQLVDFHVPFQEHLYALTVRITIALAWFFADSAKVFVLWCLCEASNREYG